MTGRVYSKTVFTGGSFKVVPGVSRRLKKLDISDLTVSK